MQIGVIKEIKDQERRVALTPQGAKTLVDAGHRVLVESQAGQGSGFGDAEYVAAGAAIVAAAEAWASELVVKVKEPLASEYAFLQGQMLFTFLHLAGGAPRALTEALLASGGTALAYETLEDAQGRLPILAPMSAIAGNMASLVGAYYLAHFNHGKGVQLGRVLGESHGKVLVVGNGTVGQHAAASALGMGAKVWMAGLSDANYQHLLATQPQLAMLQSVDSNPHDLAAHLPDTDLLVGAVLRKGAKAPFVIDEEMVCSMQPGSVIVDVSIDQGGCVATSRPTSHSAPVFVEHGVVHYCVTNMPGAYPRTATLALAAASLPYVLRLADAGLAAVKHDPGFRCAVNVHQGHVCYQPVAEAWNLAENYQEFGG